jgi:hypothetical protein
MMIVSDATTWSVTYNHNLTTQTKAKDRAKKTFIVDSSLMIVTYDHHSIFIVQVTEKGTCP